MLKYTVLAYFASRTGGSRRGTDGPMEGHGEWAGKAGKGWEWLPVVRRKGDVIEGPERGSIRPINGSGKHGIKGQGSHCRLWAVVGVSHWTDGLLNLAINTI